MTTMISRIYASRGRVEAALAELAHAGYRDVHRFGGDGPSSGSEATVEAMRGLGVPSAVAAEAAAQVKAGNVAVLVFAPFGKAQRATQILDQHQPIARADAAAVSSGSSPRADDATPLSSALGMPLLAKTKHPFESTFGFGSLTGPAWFATGAFGFGRANPSPFSSLFGLPLLTKGATPLSSLLGLGCLSSNPTPLSSLIGMPVLSTRR